jgi:hypothetical protein
VAQAVTDPTTLIAREDAPNLAIDVVPSVAEGTLTVDVSMLDDPDLLGWADDPNAWVNIVCDVTRVSSRRGATRLQGVLTRAEAGIVTIEVLDTERRFDPLLNADAIHAGTPLRLRAWGELGDGTPWGAVLFTGSIDDVPVTYARTGPPRVTLTASDLISDLAEWQATGRDPELGAGDDLLGRVGRVLAEAGIVGAVAADVDTVYAATLGSTALADAWNDVTEAADAELGRVWVNRDDELVVRGRESQLSGPVRGTLSDWHGEGAGEFEPHCCYDNLAATLGTEALTNRAIAARRDPAGGSGGLVVQRDDTYSQALYRRVRAVDRRDLVLADDGQLAGWAESLIVTGSRPELRVDTVSPAPWGAGDTAWQAVLGTDLGDRWVLRYHPEQGPTVMSTIGLLGIEHEVTPEGWSILWTTTEAPTPGDDNPTGWYVVGGSDVDGGDLLAPFGGAVPAPPP